MNIIAVYPGTFDPITNGHMDIVARGARLFDKLIVAVAENKGKKPCFDLDTRIQLAKEVLASFDNVAVFAFDNLLVEFVKQKKAKVILRGLRAVSDFEMEFQLASMNRRLDSDIETLFLTPAEDHTFISSHLVRELASLNGEIAPFVHPTVETALRKRFLAGTEI